MKVELLRITGNPEQLIEEAGRTAYHSEDKITRTSASRFCRMLLKNGHESVFEHASATFRAWGSRTFTHQIVRHRLASFTQRSQRYVEKDFNIVLPQSIKTKEDEDVFYKSTRESLVSYKKLRDDGVSREDARFVLPNALESEIVITANFREWRHIIKERISPQAQWEIREFAQLVLLVLKEHAPNIFSDLIVNG